MPPKKTYEQLLEQFDSRYVCDLAAGCWLWVGALNHAGYGTFWGTSRFNPGSRACSWLAHRWSFVRFVGPIPDDLHLDHVCKTRRCVNPAHLDPVTTQENTRRAWLDYTHCKNGHEFTPENTRMRTFRSGKGWKQRVCRECERINGRAKYRRAVARGQTRPSWRTSCRTT